MINCVAKLHEDRDDITLTTYILDNPSLFGKDFRRPAVIICPGGAYLNCSEFEAEPIAMQFTAMGYHAFVLRYGIYTEGKFGTFFPGPDEKIDVKPHCMHPNPMRDIARAFLEIRANAEEWKVDTEKLIVCGFSAGAHNCAMYATNWYKPVISEFFDKAAEIFRPAACILGYTLSDYIFMKNTPMEDPIRAGLFKASNKAFLGTENPGEETLREISPALNVTENTPPMFIWATSEDGLVPVQHSLHMAEACADKKIPFELHIFEKGPHGLSTAKQSSAMAKSVIDQDVQKWIPMCEAWLLKRFELDLPEKALWE